MRKETIYSYLKQGGLSHAGACAVMGNMYCESLLKSDNVEDRCPMSDAAYTEAVNTGAMSCYQFSRDAYGYGLCQWTYWTRKEELYKRTVAKGKSVSSEMAQCEFCLAELKRDYLQLYNYLCGDCDLYPATSRVCKEYERPAVNNVDARYAKAKEYYDGLSNDSGNSVHPVGTTNDVKPSGSATVSVRVLRKGDKGRDVFMLQTGLQDMGIDCGLPDGDYGAKTEAAVNDLKETVGLTMDGAADADVWQILLQ